jgi:ribonuclease Y
VQIYAAGMAKNPTLCMLLRQHHADVEPQTVLDVLVQAADAITAAVQELVRESAEKLYQAA